MKIYQISTCSNLTDGMGPYVPVAYFTKRGDAEKCMLTQPTIMGAGKPGQDSELKEIEVFGSFTDYITQVNEKQLQSIKNKLNAEEWRVIKKLMVADVFTEEKRLAGYRYGE